MRHTVIRYPYLYASVLRGKLVLCCVQFICIHLMAELLIFNVYLILS